MPIQLVIQLDDQGVLSMAGPIDDPLVCYGLLELAKDFVRDVSTGAAQTSAKPKIEIAPAGVLGPKKH